MNEQHATPGQRVALVTGGASGLGWAIAEALMETTGGAYKVILFDTEYGDDVIEPDAASMPSRCDVLVNCAGVNGIDWLADVKSDDWDRIMDTNAKGIFRMTQTLLPQLLASGGTVLNIVSNAAHMPMRCSAAYNASKAAAYILTKQLARELSPNVTVFSVSPNKLAGTGMSKQIDAEVMRTRGWSEEEARKYQLASLLTGEETPVEAVAEFIGFLLAKKERHKYLTGCDIPYGA